NGAFTYHLCKSWRFAGPGVDRRTLMSGVETSLRDGQFDQVPQLEAAAPNTGPIFSGTRPVRPGDVSRTDTPPPGSSGAGQQSLIDLLQGIIGPRGNLPPELQRQALDLLQRILEQRAAAAPGERAVGGRHLVYVHGICPHSKGYSDNWWNVLRQYTNAFGPGN